MRSPPGLRAGTVQLKWPNDLVAIDRRSGDVRKLAGVLGETDGLGTKDARAVIGIGVNADWKPEDFPAELATTMTSLAELAPGQVIDREVIVHVFLERLEKATANAASRHLPGRRLADRQLTNGVPVRLEWPDGAIGDGERHRCRRRHRRPARRRRSVARGQRRTVLAGEIRHLRLGGIV